MVPGGVQTLLGALLLMSLRLPPCGPRGPGPWTECLQETAQPCLLRLRAVGAEGERLRARLLLSWLQAVSLAQGGS